MNPGELREFGDNLRQAEPGLTVDKDNVVGPVDIVREVKLCPRCPWPVLPGHLAVEVDSEWLHVGCFNEWWERQA